MGDGSDGLLGGAGLVRCRKQLPRWPPLRTRDRNRPHRQSIAPRSADVCALSDPAPAGGAPDIREAESRIRQVLADEVTGYRINNVQNVACNGEIDPPINKGDTFSCDVTIDGEHKTLTVTFPDDTGVYEIGRPH